MNGDLIEIIAFYTIPDVTYQLVTFTAGIVGRLAYSTRLWRLKAAVERQGLVFSDSVIVPESAHTYYRLVCRHFWGRSAVIHPGGELGLMGSEPGTTNVHWAGPNKFTRSDYTIRKFRLPNPDTFGGSRPDQKYDIIASIPTIDQSSMIDNGTGSLRELFLTERGEVFVVEGLRLRIAGFHNVVDLKPYGVLLDRDRRMTAMVRQSGSIYQIRDLGTGAVHITARRAGRLTFDSTGRAMRAGAPGGGTPFAITAIPSCGSLALASLLIDGSIRITTAVFPSEVQHVKAPLPVIAVWSGEVGSNKIGIVLIDGTIHSYNEWIELVGSKARIQTAIGSEDGAIIIY